MRVQSGNAESAFCSNDDDDVTFGRLNGREGLDIVLGFAETLSDVVTIRDDIYHICRDRLDVTMQPMQVLTTWHTGLAASTGCNLAERRFGPGNPSTPTTLVGPRAGMLKGASESYGMPGSCCYVHHVHMPAYPKGTGLSTYDDGGRGSCFCLFFESDIVTRKYPELVAFFQPSSIPSWIFSFGH